VDADISCRRGPAATYEIVTPNAMQSRDSHAHPVAQGPLQEL